MKKLLIVYYSWSNGNTERIAKKLQSVAGGDLLKIDTAVPYSGSYDDVVDQGQREVNQGYEPELKPLNVNPADYDVIAVGTPTWWYTMGPCGKDVPAQKYLCRKDRRSFYDQRRLARPRYPGYEKCLYRRENCL